MSKWSSTSFSVIRFSFCRVQCPRQAIRSSQFLHALCANVPVNSVILCRLYRKPMIPQRFAASDARCAVFPTLVPVFKNVDCVTIKDPAVFNREEVARIFCHAVTFHRCPAFRASVAPFGKNVCCLVPAITTMAVIKRAVCSRIRFPCDPSCHSQSGGLPAPARVSVSNTGSTTPCL